MSQKKNSTPVVRAEHLARWRKSEQSQSNYCRQAQLALPTFANWLRQERMNAEKASPNVGKFIELHPSPSEAATSKDIAIYSPSGYRIQIPAGTSIEFIKALIL